MLQFLVVIIFVTEISYYPLLNLGLQPSLGEMQKQHPDWCSQYFNWVEEGVSGTCISRLFSIPPDISTTYGILLHSLLSLKEGTPRVKGRVRVPSGRLLQKQTRTPCPRPPPSGIHSVSAMLSSCMLPTNQLQAPWDSSQLLVPQGCHFLVSE